MILMMDDDLRMGTPELITSPTALTACSTLGKPAMATVVGKSGASRMVAVIESIRRQRGSYAGSKPSRRRIVLVTVTGVLRTRNGDNRQMQLTFGDDPQRSLGADEHLGQVETGRRFAA
jgi:hypothetical protein